MRRSAAALAILLATIIWPPDSFGEATKTKGVAFGQGALTYASGFITYGLPYEGRITNVTGEPQSTGNKRMLGAADDIYLKLQPGVQVLPGDIFTLYRHIHKVFHPRSGRYLGDLVNVVGLARAKVITGQYANMKVTRSYGPLYPGDAAMRFVAPTPEPAATGPRSTPEIPGFIVDIPDKQTLVAQTNVVYVDWGRKDSIYRGDRLQVFRALPGVPKFVLAELQVLSVQNETATAIIVKSTAPISRGDRFTFKEAGPPPDLAGLGEEPSGEPAVAETPTPMAVAKVEPGPAVPESTGDPQQLVNDLLSRLEYDPGAAAPKGNGQEILKEVAEVLRAVEDKHIRVEGHTDSQDIGPSLLSTYPSNQELSEARASYAVQTFTREGGLDPTSLSTIGHSDREPLASNASEEGRQKNRRIGIVLVPKTSMPPAEPTLPADPSVPAKPTVPPDPAMSGEPTGAPASAEPEPATPQRNPATGEPVLTDEPSAYPEPTPPPAEPIPSALPDTTSGISEPAPSALPTPEK